MIILADNKTCTGCYSCMNACPKGAISMMEDREGFFQPVIDTQMCVECGLCQKSCPVLNPLNKSNDGCKVYAFIDYTDRKKSSSGGAFSFLHEEYWMKAESFLERRLMNICRFIILELIVKMICQSYVAQNMFRVK